MHFKQKAYTGPLIMILSFSLLCMFFLPTAVAQEEGTVVGMIVRDDFATPIKGAIVKLYDPKTETFYSSEPTNNNGLYAIKNVPVGEYHAVIITKDGDSPCDLMIKVRLEPATPLALAVKFGEPGIKEPKTSKKWYKNRCGTTFIVGATIGIGYGIYKTTISKDKS